jgi:hypothetical protein
LPDGIYPAQLTDCARGYQFAYIGYRRVVAVRGSEGMLDPGLFDHAQNASGLIGGGSQRLVAVNVNTSRGRRFDRFGAKRRRGGKSHDVGSQFVKRLPPTGVRVGDAETLRHSLHHSFVAGTKADDIDATKPQAKRMSLARPTCSNDHRP